MIPRAAARPMRKTSSAALSESSQGITPSVSAQ
jgi:hypothetical protein